MIKRVKTKSSAPGKAAVKGSKVEKNDMLSIFSGSDEDSTENSKAFDNPQDTRGHNSSEGSKTPEINIPDPGTPGRSGSDFDNPNFGIKTKNLTSKPKDQLGISQQPLSNRATTPLQVVNTKDGSISNLSSVDMSKPVKEKYPAANSIARSNASYPSDFKTEFSPIKKGLNAESLDQRDQAKNQLYQKVTEVPFEKLESTRSEVKTKTEEKISEYTNPQIQPENFTEPAKEALTPNFFKQEMSPSNVFSEYSSSTGEYGQGQFPQSKEASSTLTQKSEEAGKASSPQRAADSIGSADGKGNFKSGEPKTFEVDVDQSGKGKVLDASGSGKYLSQKSQTSSLGSEAKSYFVSNFSPISPTINDSMSNSSMSTDSASSEVSSNMNI